MTQSSAPCDGFTVVGIVNGQYAVRVHDRVRAADAPAALAQVRAGLAARYAEASPGTTDFIAAAVFAGRLRCAHGARINGPWGEDRSGEVNAAGPGAELKPFTVMAIDPATRALVRLAGWWPGSGNAERDARLDFHLVATVLEGKPHPLLKFEQALEPRVSSRNERICAMLRYSPAFARFFGTRAPMHMPL